MITMKIVDIQAYPLWYDNRNLCLVKVTTDDGIYGWGESGLLGRELAVMGAIQHFREFLLGRDPMEIGRLWQETYRSQYFEGGRVLAAAISAIDIALHDIVGKALNVPVYQLLGGKQREYIPCFITTRSGMGPQLIDEVKELIDRGWNVIRTFPGKPETDEDPLIFEPRESIGLSAKWLTKLREEVGADPVLGIDYHHRLNVAETASFCQRMPKGTLDFLEEPIRDEAPEAYEALRRMVDIPFALGEEFASKWAFVPFIERGITDFVRVDVCNVGGLTEAKKVAGWAEAHYIDLMPHNPLGPVCTAASIHLGAAAPNFSWFEVLMVPDEGRSQYHDDAFPLQPKLEGSRFPVPTAPGLGVEVDEAFVRQQSFRYYEPAHLRKRDGSKTNW
jgi:galactonate dehydratase